VLGAARFFIGLFLRARLQTWPERSHRLGNRGTERKATLRASPSLTRRHPGSGDRSRFARNQAFDRMVCRVPSRWSNIDHSLGGPGDWERRSRHGFSRGGGGGGGAPRGGGRQTGVEVRCGSPMWRSGAEGGSTATTESFVVRDQPGRGRKKDRSVHQTMIAAAGHRSKRLVGAPGHRGDLFFRARGGGGGCVEAGLSPVCPRLAIKLTSK